jgi:hypothetical protein
MFVWYGLLWSLIEACVAPVGGTILISAAHFDATSMGSQICFAVAETPFCMFLVQESFLTLELRTWCQQQTPQRSSDVFIAGSGECSSRSSDERSRRVHSNKEISYGKMSSHPRRIRSGQLAIFAVPRAWILDVARKRILFASQ